VLELPVQDEAAAQSEEGEVHGVATFLAHAQAFHPMKPRQRALHDPAMAPESLPRLDPSASDAGDDVALSQPTTNFGVVVPFVAVRLARPPTRVPARALDGQDGVEERQRLAHVVNVGRRQQDRQR